MHDSCVTQNLLMDEKTYCSYSFENSLSCESSRLDNSSFSSFPAPASGHLWFL